MDYLSMKEGVQYFRRKWPSDLDGQYSYTVLRERGADYWRHLDRLPDKKRADAYDSAFEQLRNLFEEVIEGFLNTREWNCHIPTKNKEKLYKVLTSLQVVLEDTDAIYKKLELFILEKIDFDMIVSYEDSNNKRLHVLITEIYEEFLSIEPKFGKVPASKLMHMALPNLFPMWDNGIIDRYGLPAKKMPKGERNTSYLAFMILMQENLLHVLKTYYSDANNNKQGTNLSDSESAFHGLPLPRLLDMVNMAVRDCELPICIPCMRKAKQRWAHYGIIPDYDGFENAESSE